MDAFLPLLTAILAFCLTAGLGIVIIPWLHRLKFGQTILDIGPSWHKEKQGTPTMGGIMFIIGITVALVLAVIIAFAQGNNRFLSELQGEFSQLWLRTIRLTAGFISALSFGVIGFIDDYIKVVKKRNLGLTARQKTLLQFLIAAAFLGTLALSGDTTTMIPIVGMVDVSHGWGLLYWPIAMLFIYGFVNAVNLTDGIDGLCGTVTMVISAFYMLATSFSGMLTNTSLNILASASAGGCGGFLVWNMKPARVFMGDTGSLFLGGLVVAMAFLSGYPILLLLTGIIYLLEALSDVIQVFWYKKTKKRVFKMAPIHHHFELSGWSENKIVAVFSAITAVSCILAGILIHLTVS